MIKEFSEIREISSSERMEISEGLNKLQTEYLKELNIPSDVWNGMSKKAQSQQLGFILERFNEIDTSKNVNREAIFSEIYSSGIMETYKQSWKHRKIIYRLNKSPICFPNVKNFKYGNWQKSGIIRKKQMCLISWKQRLQK